MDHRHVSLSTGDLHAHDPVDGQSLRQATDPDRKPHPVHVAWAPQGPDLAMPVDIAEWWGASLGVLVAAVHHPAALAASQPDTDPVAVAWDVAGALPELYRAAETSAGQGVGTEVAPAGVLRRRGNDLVFSPGTEVANLALVLDTFAAAVINPTGVDAQRARGALAYSAAAWSREIGLASGALAGGELAEEAPEPEGLGL